MAEARSTDKPIVVELIKLIPQLTWAIITLLAFYALYQPLLSYIDKGKISEFNVWKIQVKFAQVNLAAAQTSAGAIKTAEEFAPFEDRIRRLSTKIAGANILWVDDNHPTQNLAERRAFSALGINIDMVKSTEEAMKMLDVTSYDLIISDMYRPGQPDNETTCGNPMKGAGCGLLKSVHKKLLDKQPPIIIYSTSYNQELGTPFYTFGITNRTDDLLQYILDAVERRPVPKS